MHPLSTQNGEILGSPGKTLWMIGHSNHRVEKFLGLLKRHEIKALWDVRTSPRSYRFPWFDRDALRLSCQSADIDYLHMGKLGGKDPLPPAGVRDFLRYVLPPTTLTAMMCSEGDFHGCHRHYLLAPVVVLMGYRVLQITQDGDTIEDRGNTPPARAPQNLSLW